MRNTNKMFRMATCLLLGFTISAVARHAQISVPSLEGSSNIEGSFLLTRAELPLYPPLARIARLSGNVHLSVSTKEGVIVAVEARSTAALVLVEAAKQNVKTWIFDRDTNGSFEVDYIYALENNEVASPQNPRIEMRLPFYIRITAKPVITNTLYGGK
jgi:hypothetical protein